MRTLTADHLAAQKSNTHRRIVQLVVDGDTHVYRDDSPGTSRIISIEETESPDSHIVTVVLDNSDKALDDEDYKGLQAIISCGEVDANGVDRVSPFPPFYVMSMDLRSSPGLLIAVLDMIGIPNLLSLELANQYINGDNDGQDTVKDLLTGIVQATNIAYDHTTAWTATYDSEDGLLDTVQPKGDASIHVNDSKLVLINDLLRHSKVEKRVEDDAEVHFFVPTISGQTWVAATAYVLLDYVQPTSPNNNFTYRCTTAGTSGGSEPTFPTTAGGTVNDNGVVWTAVAPDYEYALDVTGEHTFFKKAHRKPFIVPNSVQVKSIPDDGDGFIGLASDSASSAIRLIRVFFEQTLASDDQAVALAKAEIERYRLRNETGSGEVPMNVGAEVNDWVKFTDKRQGDVRLGSIGYLQRFFGPNKWKMIISLGDIRNATFTGRLPPDVKRIFTAEGPIVDNFDPTVPKGRFVQKEGGLEFGDLGPGFFDFS